MKRFGFVLFVMLAIVANVAADERLISGYGTGEFAVKGEIERQVKILVAEIKAAQPDSTDLVITVIGSADNRGISAQNDQLSKNRAEAVEGVLASEFPKAKINVVPKGDGENSRQVVVEYKFVKITPDKNLAGIEAKIDSNNKETNEKLGSIALKIDENKKAKLGRFLPLALISGLALVVVIIISVVIHVRRKRAAVPETAPEEIPWNGKVEELKIATEANGTWWCKVAYKWRIVNHKREEVFISPFKNTGDQKTNIEMPSKGDIVNSLKRCLKQGSQFASQVATLVGTGEIQKI